MTSLRHRLGVWLYERRSYRKAIESPGQAWLALRNRHESIRVAADGRGVACEWNGSSELHAARVMPTLGHALLRRALREHPVRFAAAPAGETPRVSFLIGHRGPERLPCLRAVLASIAAQERCPIECVVVEETLPGAPLCSLPDWVRHLRIPVSEGEGYRRGRNFNVGARAARAGVLILHDGDILVPCDYAAEAAARVAAGAEFVDLKRYLFYLTSRHSDRILEDPLSLAASAPEAVVQNAPGGTMAAHRTAFEDIGGFDEEFEGWGGEDVEFLERAATRRLDRFTSLPFLHLWHPAQPGKTPRKETPGMALYAQRTTTAPADRIVNLRLRRNESRR